MKAIRFLGSSLESLRAFSDDARHDAGYQLYQVQQGNRPGSILETDEVTTMKAKIEQYTSVWDAIADSPEQAANLRARADLIRQIADYIQSKGWKQVEAAERCGVTQPRINELINGRVSRFSLDALVNIATALGFEVKLLLKAA